MKTKTALVVLNTNDPIATICLCEKVLLFSNIDYVVLVDNCSSDNSLEIFEKELHSSKLHIISTDHDGGYGYGYNYGFRYIFDNFATDFIFAVNADTVFNEECINECIRLHQKHKECGVLSPLMLDKNLKPDICVYPFPSIKYFENNLNFKKNRQQHANDIANFLRIKDKDFIKVDWCRGSFQSFKTEALKKSGMFDEDVFLYGEERLLAKRLNAAGFYCGYTGKVSYIHNHNNRRNSFKRIKTVSNSALKSMIIYAKKYLNITPKEIKKLKQKNRTNILLKYLLHLRVCLLRKNKKNSKTVFVSGANGYLGHCVVKKLYLSNTKLICLVKDKNEDVTLLKRISKIIYMDEQKDLKLKDRINTFLHLAWQGVNGSDKGNIDIQENNVKLAMDLTNFALKHGMKHLVGVGTITERVINGNIDPKTLKPSALYGFYKKKCYQKLLEYSKKEKYQFTWLQLANVYSLNNNSGNILSYAINSLAKGEVPSFSSGLQPYDFISLDDVSVAICNFVLKDETNENLYYIGSGSPRLLKEYLFALRNAFGENARIELGVRPDDGMKYDITWMDNTSSIKVIGNYISSSFDKDMISIANNLKEINHE